MHSMLNTPIDSGLSERAAAGRLSNEGYNELPSQKPRNIFAIAIEVAREPMFLLLLGAGAIYLLLGDVQEALILLSFVFLVMGITFNQERKTERALEALRDLSSPRALVIRDGQQKRIAGREVVRGDLLVLAEGDRVPADAVLLSGTNLMADESLLTGESVPVRKVASDSIVETARPGGDDLPFVYSGTLIVKGQGIARVLTTGAGTEIGKISKSLYTVESEQTALQKEVRRLVRSLALTGAVVSALVVIGYGLTRGNWLDGLLAGISLAMAMLPEELPVVLTIFLPLGAWRISQQRVLTRRVPAIEALGAATVLCVDKTGTLTLNRMALSRIFSRGAIYDAKAHAAQPLLEGLHPIVEFAVLASHRDPFDPMDIVFREFGDHYLAQTEHLHADWTLMREYPLSPNLLALSQIWRSPAGGDYVIAAKGAPEAIADLCHFAEAQLQELATQISAMADAGLRVLGVARAYFQAADLPAEQHDFQFEFLGLIGLADPIRPTVPAAVKECYGAGIRVVMITGDYPGTAQSIARQIGLSPRDQCITRVELAQMSDADLQQRIRTTNIFAHMVPEQKLRLVNALKANGEVVAMTGDGVNDAPALKAAHIGIAMGGRGTDVAREAAALVLLDDDFSSIVSAVRLGRRIFDNLKKAMDYIFAIHVPIAGLSLIPALLKWPLILLPAHIVFLEMIIDPACSTVFEAESEEADVMNRPPRNSQLPLINRRNIVLCLLQGASVLLIVLAVYVITVYREKGELEARAMAFTTLIIANLALILTNRSWSRTILEMLRSSNAALGRVLAGAVVFLALVLYMPFLRELFRFNELHLDDLLITLAAGLISILWFEVFKLISRNTRPAQGSIEW